MINQNNKSFVTILILLLALLLSIFIASKYNGNTPSYGINDPYDVSVNKINISNINNSKIPITLNYYLSNTINKFYLKNISNTPNYVKIDEKSVTVTNDAGMDKYVFNLVDSNNNTYSVTMWDDTNVSILIRIKNPVDKNETIEFHKNFTQESQADGGGVLNEVLCDNVSVGSCNNSLQVD